MLDAKELAERLRAAMDLREPPLGSSELARKCGVSKQAVYEWRTTGRMGKAHLIRVAEETGMPLEFFLEHERGSSATTKAIWRKLGKAFAKVAMLAALTLAFLLPEPVGATGFHNKNLASAWANYTLNLFRLLRMIFVAMQTLPDAFKTAR